MSIPLIYREDLAETILVTRTQRIHIPFNEKVSYFCHLSKYVFPKFDILDIIEGVAEHGLIPKRLSISDLMTISYKQLKAVLSTKVVSKFELIVK